MGRGGRLVGDGLGLAGEPGDRLVDALGGEGDLGALGDEALASKLEAERTAMAAQIAAKEEKLQKEIEEL